MKTLFWILGILLVASIAVNVFILTRQPEVKEKRDTDYVVRWDTIHDSLPPEKGEKIVKYIAIPCLKSPQDSLIGDSLIQDSASNTLITLPIVQKKYSDDSTYTAYVSGLKYGIYPRLDSIITKHRIIERTITNTIRGKQSRWHVGMTAGYGYGFRSRTLEPFIGIGLQYSFW